MAEPLLKANQLGIMFGGLKAVQKFGIEIKRGELVGLIGPNGAGKTTVFNLLTGRIQAVRGRVLPVRQAHERQKNPRDRRAAALRARSRTSGCSKR